MADEGTLATSTQVLLAIGSNAGAAQILEANTNYWIKMAESEMMMVSEKDLIAKYATITANTKQWLALISSTRAAMIAINQNQQSWNLSVTQSKLNVLDSIWRAGLDILKDKDKLALMGL